MSPSKVLVLILPLRNLPVNVARALAGVQLAHSVALGSSKVEPASTITRGADGASEHLGHHLGPWVGGLANGGHQRFAPSSSR